MKRSSQMKGNEMGNRAFIQVESKDFASPVIFYGHWSGDDNITAVKNVLARTGRIGDANYLTAQLFYEFAVTLGGYDGNLSFGIESGTLSGEEWEDTPSVFVNADTGTYSVEGEVFTEFARVTA